MTRRISVATVAGAKITQYDFERLEDAGLVTRDTSRPLHAGQPGVRHRPRPLSPRRQPPSHWHASAPTAGLPNPFPFPAGLTQPLPKARTCRTPNTNPS